MQEPVKNPFSSRFVPDVTNPAKLAAWRGKAGAPHLQLILPRSMDGEAKNPGD